MKSWITYLFKGLAALLLVVASGCNKDEPEVVRENIIGLKVYDDNSIKTPIQVVAGNGTLLCAYYTWDNLHRFMLTDNNGRHLWTREFGVSKITGMLAENDGTFTIFDKKRRINIDAAGSIKADDPDFLVDIENYETIHVMLNNNGNYFFYGCNTETMAFIHYAFAFEITHSGVSIFKKIFTANTIFTSCQLTSDGGYLFLGNQFLGNSQPTRFFLCKMGPTGVIDWVKYHAPPGPGIGAKFNFYYTHDLLKTNDGNYFCFIGSPDPDVSTEARIYKVTPVGDLIDSTDINFAGKNIFAGGNEDQHNLDVLGYLSNQMGYGALKKEDGSCLVYLNNRGETNASYAVGGNQSFSMELSDDLSIGRIGYLQNVYFDYYTSVCRTSDGKNAAFGYISGFGGLGKPVILISE